ncbi:E3 ubiquitin-protein ligase SHPRH isoform X1 [Denticeps clupeoides]|uniref:E3 ubiquitin-protein ligase SHPRH isoform X1 n=1 Tax=Denticeps clupeoides TaxID=299321 RepID=UPI0010A4E055|nr:E3 ubiquitin-protein ligase SHPRH isoform X1 [Denticeps clupeoides]XP_028837996.1 E3 ubiquitin-protein ligase SHPRH isoform X1 [Denticeps clupeoides]
MSSRRKRSTPVRVDEEVKRKLEWNMQDRKKDLPERSGFSPFFSSSFSGGEARSAAQCNGNVPCCSSSLSLSRKSSPIPFYEETGRSNDLLRSKVAKESGNSSHSTIDKSFALSVLPTSDFGQDWKALIGEFVLHCSTPLNVENKTIFLSRTCNKIFLGPLYSGEEYPVECSFSNLEWDDIEWLQKRRILQLYHKFSDGSIKLQVYLLEAGLGRPEFPSETNGRIKKANQLMQKIMSLFYNFTIPEVMENYLGDGDIDLERQNVEELYDFVRDFHQQEAQDCIPDIQHENLIPILRPYQYQAVNWMLHREKYKSPLTQAEPCVHLLWRRVVTLCGKKLYFNIYTGCVVQEFPMAELDCPGGILADEMGLGKTVEVLVLILLHKRQDLHLESLTLPEGRAVNYFVPSIESERESKSKSKATPKEKISYPAVRVMLLTAIREVMDVKGASVKAIFAYLRTIYNYDPMKNRNHIKKTLAKLISEENVVQVKGHGLTGSLRLGKSYKDKKKDSALHKYNSSGDTSTATSPRSPSVSNEKKITDCSCPVQCTKEQPIKKNEHDKNMTINIVKQCKFNKIKEEMLLTTGKPALLTNKYLHFPLKSLDYRFECICGESGLLDNKAQVQCLNCQLWQHAKCMNYKQEDVAVTPFYCPHCLVAMTLVPTGATLIISPSSISRQWEEEIIHHVRSASLRVLVYQGVKHHGFIQPHVLAEQDVVITTYDVLRTELNYVDIPHSNSEDGRRFRNQKRYMAVPSPLVAVEWWRICLDEAQMVECTTAKAAEMALHLTAVNRWCVSGTPVQRGLEDLYGLVLFLKTDPFWIKHWWDQLLYRPFLRRDKDPLYNLMGKLLWRSAKKDVIDQIQVPPQMEEIHWLTFSAVEGHFYNRQHEVCSQDALLKLRKISDWSLRVGSLDRRTVHCILYPLLRLRQACCHPQAVRGEFLPFQTSTMTMEELLKSLQKKCRLECEEAHRLLVCAQNGLAGIHIIKGEFVEATEMYREVLYSSEDHKYRIKTDSLQRLHATHNLMELLNSKYPGIPPTLRDDKLKEEAEQIRQHYMTKSNSKVLEAHQALQPIVQNIKELKRKINMHSPWWLDITQKAIQHSVDDDLVLRVKNELTGNYKDQTNKLSMAVKFQDIRGLQFMLCTQMEDLIKSQKAVQDAVKKLEGPPSHETIEQTTICHLRPVRMPLNNCAFCKADALFSDYESKLFSHTVKGQSAIFEEMIEDEDILVDEHLPTTSRGLWAPSEIERALKSIMTFAKARRLDPDLVEEGNTFMELFEFWKKEYKVLHEKWMTLRDHVSAIDELGMATETLRVRLPDEPKSKVLHIIEPHEVEQNRVKLMNDQAVAKSQLQKKLGQLLYLTNLEMNNSTGRLNPEPCPICTRPLGQEWAVLICGHCFCNECVSIMVEQYSVGMRKCAIKCAICRRTISHTEISYVYTNQATKKGQDIAVKGSHSTKVEAVVRTLKRIQMNDPGAKSLVFSTWQGVLDIIAKALIDNSMEFSMINGIHKFQDNLSSFKYKENVNILLLPLHTGSNGLNIIEATHVLLVEPILNPAHELQAIGRVHRIGQTRPTFVHRFLIKSTIEERMQAMLRTAEKSHTIATMTHLEASLFTVADLAELFTGDGEALD